MKLNMAYKVESEEIINRMKEKQKETAEYRLKNLQGCFVPRVWMERRWATLSSITDQPSYINTVGKKHEATIRDAEKLLDRRKELNQSMQFLQFDIEEYFEMVSEIHDYTVKVNSKQIKANYQEYMTVINTILIAYGKKFGLIESSVEDWLARENSTDTDYRGRAQKRSADPPSIKQMNGEGGLFPWKMFDRY